MNIHYYMANSPAEAFEMASKDTKWGFPVMDSLTEMAQLFRDGFTPKQDGLATSCFCKSGWFKLFGPEKAKGYGIALVTLKGHEAGIDDPAAREVLAHHREHRGKEMYAEALLVYAEHISSIEDLDAAYANLLAGNLIVETNKTVTVTDGDKKRQRRAYRTR